MYRIEVNHRKDLSFSVKSGGHEFIIDAKGSVLRLLMLR